MSGELETAVFLLAVGMATVFTVLFLVVLTGNFLIWLSNKFSVQVSASVFPEADALDKKKIAAITGAVEAFTLGNGRVVKIEKINDLDPK